ncbi:helix-turn-helix domain-containing protein [Rhodospirillum sp. A1_3_36]|uniref:helix-turn-helix domain-containing protein n=1 Tax=Rhodospirillum sp. A1_3_36 TaxID=3391666 RepID=UPI0039A73C4E
MPDPSGPRRCSGRRLANRHAPQCLARSLSSPWHWSSLAGAPFDLDWQDLDEQTSIRHRVETGQFHILPPMTPVQLHWTGTQTAAVITFSPTFLSKVADEFLDGVMPRIAPRAALSDTIVRYLTSTLHDKIGRREHHITRCAERISASLPCHLLASFGETQVPRSQAKGGLGTAQQRRVLAFIEAHVGEGVGVDTLAAEAGLSRHHFSRAFKKTFGQSPCRYAQERLIHKATERLLTSRESITEIAHDMGFSSSNYFAFVFRKHMGVGPEEFRRQHGIH